MIMPKEYKMSWIINGNDPHADDPKTQVLLDNGQSYWIPARSEEIPNFKTRLSLAWGVFTGRLDAIDSRK